MGASICGRYIWQIMEKRAAPQGVARGGGGGSPLRRRSERNLKSRKERCSAARRSGAAISWDSKVSAFVIALVEVGRQQRQLTECSATHEADSTITQGPRSTSTQTVNQQEHITARPL